MAAKVALLILDGWGVGKSYAYNAVDNASTPNLTAWQAQYPQVLLNCSGEAVGLPEGQMGNSEVGHLNIGAGRVVYQELTRISKDIREGGFYQNPQLRQAMQSAVDKGRAVHIMGLLSDGGVHSHNTHLYALLKLAKQMQVPKVYIHAFLDGRDVPPQSGLGFVQDLEAHIAEIGVGAIASVAGRYYAMDRDQRHERVELAYQALTGSAPAYATAVDAVQAAYEQQIYDEFVKPCVIAPATTQGITSGDSVIFFNFRPDRARQITRALIDPEFIGFKRQLIGDLNFVCMTEYDKTICAPVAYAQQNLTNTLGEVLAKAGKTQLRIAETEKYAHVTFFFNGGVEAPNPLEERVLIASPKVATYDLQPEMSAYQVKERLIELVQAKNYDTIILNFANADMVGHTGNYQAGIQAMQAVDACVGEVVEKLLAADYKILITADHGNLEYMQDEQTRQPYTAHTSNQVRLLLLSREQLQLDTQRTGSLADIAPTILQLLSLEQPAEMSGTSLLK